MATVAVPLIAPCVAVIVTLAVLTGAVNNPAELMLPAVVDQVGAALID